MLLTTLSILCAAWPVADVGSADVTLLTTSATPRAAAATPIVREAVQDSCSRVVAVSPDELTTWLRDPPHQDGRFLVVPDIESFPAAAIEALPAWLAQGGRLIAFGRRPFADPIVQWDGRTLPTSAAWRELAAKGAMRGEFDDKQLTLDQWQVYAGAEDPRPHVRFDPPAPVARGRVLHVRAPAVHSYVAVMSPTPAHAAAADDNVMFLSARGGPRTPRLLIERRERDGSRWMAVIDVSTEWQSIAVPASAFKFWPDGSAPGRGGRGDGVRFAKTAAVGVGLARSHDPLIPDGPQEFEVADLGTGAAPAALAPVAPPIIEGLSPPYCAYGVDVIGTLRPRSDESILDRASGARFTAPSSPTVTIDSPIWRPRGTGLVRDATHRFIPLITTPESDGDPLTATLASLTLGWLDGGRCSEVAWFGTNDPAFLRYGDNLDALKTTLSALFRPMERGVFLRCAGADRAYVFSGETITVGAVIRNNSDETFDGHVTLQVDGPGLAKPFEVSISVRVLPHEEQLIHEPWRAPPPASDDQRPDDEYTVTAVVSGSKQTIDHIVHPFRVGRAERPDPNRLVTVRDGAFVLGDSRWHAVGVNFWPRYVAGRSATNYSRHWLWPREYDPLVVQRDLDLLRRHGMTALSIQYLDAGQARPLRDFLSRCGDLKVDLYLPHLSVHDRDPEKGIDLIRAARLWESDACWSYNLAWEAHLGDYATRRRFDADWRAWVERRYGDFDAAETRWGVRAPRADGKSTGPTDEQVSTDGVGRIMVADYRAFVDDLVDAHYGKVREMIRAVDPHHLITVRNGFGGTGQYGVDSRFPIDMAGGARHLDFLCPEGWGLAGEPDDFLKAGFTTEYSRYVSGGKPVVWLEFGMNIWPATTAPASREAQANVYKDFVEMVVRSRADGAVAWWYPGGYRVDENSDYGVFDPDGTPRPAALFLSRCAARLGERRDPPRGEPVVIELDRDLDARGYSALWHRHAAAYLDTLRAGRPVVLKAAPPRTASRPATTQPTNNER